MRKVLLAATAIGVLAIPAYADTLTGTYTVSFTDPGTTTTVTDNLTNPGTFSMTLGAARSGLLTINPNACFSGCFPNTVAFSVTFNNLTADGHNFGSFTEGGVYTANFFTQTDTVVWNLATAQSGFGTDQDGSIPLVYTKVLNGGPFGTLDINLIDGSDWDVQTYVEASLQAAPVPGPIVGAGLPGLIAGCLSLLSLNKLRRRRQGLAA